MRKKKDFASIMNTAFQKHSLMGLWVNRLMGSRDHRCLLPINPSTHQLISIRLFVLLFCCLFISGAIAENALPRSMRQAVEEGIERTIMNDFNGAAAIFREMIAAEPDNPCGYFYLGATLQAEMLDLENYARLDTFNQLMEQTIDLAKARRENNPQDVWALFFEGSAYLYRSFMDSKRKKMWGAYRNAVKGAGRLEEAIRRDSTFYDAYLGVGSYKYWKSSKAGALTWLPFLADDRELGIEMVETAIDRGQFVKLVGRDQLAWILIDRGEMARALELARDNHRRYPESRFFLWTLAEIYYRSEQWDAALPRYRELLEAVQVLPENNHYNEINCLLHLAEIHFQRGEFEQAEARALDLLALRPEEIVWKRTDRKRERARELIDMCRREKAGERLVQ